MRINELDYFLSAMMDSYPDISDLNFTPGRPLQVEVYGELVPIITDPPIGALTPFQTEHLALKIIAGNRRLTEDLLRTGSCDCSYGVSDRARFRVNIFSQRGNYSIVLRKLNTAIPTLAELGLPTVLSKPTDEKTGLVLLTGATGSGKSTTLAAMLGEINNKRACHIITLEDPVEFVHTPVLSTFNQREMGNDFDTYANGLRAALRQAPKIILVGEMRDRLTVEIALTAAETGHLVFSTLHTIDAGQTVNRILGMFDPEEQEQVRYRLADTLRWVISQRLVPKQSGGRMPLLEIMGTNLRVNESVIHGESDGKSFYEIIEASTTFGWRTFDYSCLEAYESGVISEEIALRYATKRGHVSRGIDMIRKKQGLSAEDLVKLNLSSLPAAGGPAKGAPAPRGAAEPGLRRAPQPGFALKLK
ncbi:MAG: PilT/PilU family type 4a pilus ATPase [Verrucomicrobia bacterium]|nr:PilT/PilU family type 4a pilus ATPase [Verrucomicrobiota bacterium]